MGLPVLFEVGISEGTFLAGNFGVGFGRPVEPDLEEKAVTLTAVDALTLHAQHSWTARAKSWMEILASSETEKQANIQSMDSIVQAPMNLLVHQDGARVTDTLNSSHYYGLFLRFLEDPLAKSEEYKEILLRSDLVDSTVYRGQCIKLSAETTLPYDEVRSLVPLTDWKPSPDVAAQLVMNNYLAMRNPATPYRIVAKIDEFGRIVVFEGLHRTVLNHLAGFTSQPAIILHRSPEWLAFVDFFRSEGEALYKDGKTLYHEIRHPDFADFKVIRQDRSGPIIDFLQRRGGVKRGLDIGSMIGFYSHALGIAGYEMHAIEYEKKYADAFRRLTTLYNSGATVENSDLYKVEIPGDRFDFAIMLSIVYHLIRNDPERAEKLISDLREKIPLFFIDTETRTGILPESRLRALFPGFSFECLFRGDDGRDIFAISW